MSSTRPEISLKFMPFARGRIAKRKLTELEKVQIANKREYSRQFFPVEIEVIVDDYTDENGNPSVIVRPKK
jgi:hypothetical protein